VDLKSLYESTIGKGILAVVGTATVVGSFVAISNVIATDSELSATEARIISEVRSESAGTRLALIEDMESRLDEYDYDISIIEANGEQVPEARRIKRNMLDRRIQRLKNNENDNSSDSN
jgi:hypothetical protein